jgi:acetyltransferase-like isoleucine patch superfamily enzyme
VARAAIHLLDRKAHVTIGRDCFLNGTDIVACERVTIGDRCLIGDTDIFETDFHSVQQRPGGKPRTGPITIGDDVWIAAKTAVLRGTTIGDRSVVGYGSVVSGDIPADHVARPSPLRVSAIAGLPSSAGRV